MKKEIITIKYPFRYLEQIIIVGLIIFLGINYKLTFDDGIYSLIFVILCIIELFSIIYMVRNKTYYYVDKANYKYLIKRKDLNNKREKDVSEELVADHFRYSDKDIDILNVIDLFLSLPSNNIINKRIKDKVLNYSKYQIESVNIKFNFIGIKCYSLIFKNNKCNNIITFNNLID